MVRRGLTLPETLIAGLVSFTLFGVVTALLVAGCGLLPAVSERASNLGAAAHLLARLEADLAGSVVVVWSPEQYPAASGCNLIIRSPLDRNGRYRTLEDGSPAFQKKVIYYRHKTRMLRLETEDRVFTALSLRDLCQGAGTLVAERVERIYFELRPDRLDFRCALGDPATDEVVLASHVFP